MSKREKEFFLLDIIIAIAKIKNIVKDYSKGDELLYNYKDWDTVIREFEIIGEAMKYCIQFGLFNDERDNRKVVDFRNILSHKYFGIDTEAVLNTAKESLDWLEDIVIKRFVQIAKNKRDEILDFMIEENRYLPFVIKKLISLKNG